MDDNTTDQLFLLTDVSEINKNGIIASKLTTNQNAFPLLSSDTNDNTITAACEFKNGKIVAVGHEQIFNRPREDYPSSVTFSVNVFRWMTSKARRPRVGILVRGYSNLKRNLTESGFTVAQITADQLHNADALFTDVYHEYTSTDLGKIRKFVRLGGGLVVAGHNWYYQHDWVNGILFNCGITITTTYAGGSKTFVPLRPSPSSSVSAIVEGVNSIDLDGSTPSILSVYGNAAFGLIASDDGVIIAGAHYGVGRVLHVSHGRILELTGKSESTLIHNIITWLTGRNLQNKKVGFLADGFQELRETLQSLDFDTSSITTVVDFSAFNTIVVTCYTRYTTAEINKIYSFVEAGGGLLSSGHNWYYKNPWASDIVKPAGIMITIAYGSNHVYQIPKYDTRELNLRNATFAIKGLINHLQGKDILSKQEQGMARATILSASRILPLTTQPFYEETQKFLELLQVVIPSSDTPLDVHDQPIKAAYVYLSNGIAAKETPANVVAHPAASSFPGLVPDYLTPVDVTVEINGTFESLPSYFRYASDPVRRSTGIYASPGEEVSITVPSQYLSSGLEVLVGAHTDTLFHKDELYRYPDITRTFKIVQETTMVANAFGGNVFILVRPGSLLGVFSVAIAGGYKSPYYKHGVTTEEEWRTSLTSFPVPFCELLADDKIGFTIPTSDATTYILHPADLMTSYIRTVDVMAVLSGFNVDRKREERFVLDVQISAGYMHAGYPVMGNVASTYVFDTTRFSSHGLWGPFHELGHNLQSEGWNPSGTGEATNNIFSIYCSEYILKIPLASAHETLDPTSRAQRIAHYIEGGRNYAADWSVWTALETYLQLIEAFGWQFIREMLTIYNNPMTNRPTRNQEILDTWMVISSQKTGYNLGPFYLGWGWPVSKEALDQISTLPFWPMNPMPLASTVLKLPSVRGNKQLQHDAVKGDPCHSDLSNPPLLQPVVPKSKKSTMFGKAKDSLKKAARCIAANKSLGCGCCRSGGKDDL